MRYALDSQGNRVHIDSTHIKEDYFCDCCGEKLVLKKGEIRMHHFAHPTSSHCNDHWHYDMSDWHLEWQEKFESNYLEIVKKQDNFKHRADVLIEEIKAVIEFQHSPLDPDEFTDRNRFYNSLGYKVIWLFDFTDQYNAGSIEPLDNDGRKLKWTRPRNTFNYLTDVKNPNVAIYFQFATWEETFDIDDNDYREDWICRVSWIAPTGFERFAIDRTYTKDEFLILFKNYLRNKVYLRKERAYDRLIETRRKDHTTYFAGCPLSTSGQCCNSTIDVPESRYSEIRPCQICEHSYNDYRTYFCMERFSKLNLSAEAKLVEVIGQAGHPDEIIYELNGVEYRAKLPKSTSSSVLGSSMLELWAKEKIGKVAIFKNLRTGYFVKMGSDPAYQLSRFGKVLGYFSSQQISFPKERREIYGVTKPEWVLVWKLN